MMMNSSFLESSQEILNPLGDIICCSNGLFLCGHHHYPSRTYYIFNPYTKECYQLPSLPRRQRRWIMGLLVDVNGYKVVSADIGFLNIKRDTNNVDTIEMEIFSSVTCEWSQSRVTVKGSTSSLPWLNYTSPKVTVIRGAIHWNIHEYSTIAVYDPYNKKGGDDHMEMIKTPPQFNFSAETSFMGESSDGLLQIAALSIVNMVIKVFVFPDEDEEEEEERWWLLIHELRVNNPLPPSFNHYTLAAFHPGNPEAVFLNFDGYIYLYHLKTTRLESVVQYHDFQSQPQLYPYCFQPWPPISPNPITSKKLMGC